MLLLLLLAVLIELDAAELYEAARPALSACDVLAAGRLYGIMPRWACPSETMLVTAPRSTAACETLPRLLKTPRGTPNPAESRTKTKAFSLPTLDTARALMLTPTSVGSPLPGGAGCEGRPLVERSVCRLFRPDQPPLGCQPHMPLLGQSIQLPEW